jgi:hypothetical protein
LTTVMSSSSMKVATLTAANVHHLRCISSPPSLPAAWPKSEAIRIDQVTL